MHPQTKDYLLIYGFDNTYSMNKKIKVFTAFSGYDSQMMALNSVAERHKGQIEFELVGWS